MIDRKGRKDYNLIAIEMILFIMLNILQGLFLYV